MNKFLKELFSWSLHIILAVVLVVIVNTFLVQPTQVQGSSMESTLHNKDRVLINRIPHTLKQDYNYGDIVVIDSRVDRPRKLIDEITLNFKNNLIAFLITHKQENFYWIKRVVGKEGDVLEFGQDFVKRNGKIIEEPYLNEIAYYSENKITVPKGHVFVMGDNRNVSQDSRHIGTVPIQNVLGKFWFKIGK